MTITDFLCLSPFLILSGAPLLIMLMIAISRNYKVIYGFSVLSFVAAFLSISFVLPFTPHNIDPLFIFDNFSLFLIGIIIIASILVTLLSNDYLIHHEGEKEEYFIILFLSALGASILATANHFISFFLGVETLSISLYILIAYRRTLDFAIEAGVKYLILASVSSAFLLFGMALIYAGTGTMELDGVAFAINASVIKSPIILAGFAMMMVGIGFKLALVPFHMWTPDVYEGAPSPVGAFIATASKGGVMAVLIRFFYDIRGFQHHNFIIIISFIAVISMFTGNLLAIRQQNIKRILAYSSIANMGYLLVILLAGAENGGIHAAIFYLISYFITTIGAFGVISVLSGKEKDLDNILSYKGLFWKRPWIAIVFTLSMLSLAGIPITAGFIAKFYIIFAGIKSGLWLLVFSLIINSVIGLYYYLKVISTLFSSANEEKLPDVSLTGHIVLGILAFLILWIGIFPAWLIDIITRYSELF